MSKPREYIYAYSTTSPEKSGARLNSGCLSLSEPINNVETYQEVHKHLIGLTESKGEMVITSLNLVSHFDKES